MERYDIKSRIIVAVSENGCIGRRGSLPWHFSEDLKWFKEVTTGHTVIMGRKTWQSLGGKPLPNRRNIVLSGLLRTIPKGKTGNFVTWYLPAAINYVENKHDSYSREYFIIGGADVYKAALPLVNTVFLTKVPGEYGTGDGTFFPLWPLESGDWQPQWQISRESPNKLEFWIYKKLTQCSRFVDGVDNGYQCPS